MQDEYYDKVKSAYLLRNAEKKDFRAACNIAGLGALLVNIISLGISVIVAFILGWLGKVGIKTELFEELYSLAVSVIGMSIPAIIITKWGKNHGFTPVGVDKIEKKVLLRYFMLCLGVLYAANVITSIFVSSAEMYGVKFSQPDFSLPGTVPAFFVYFIEMTLGAGIFEELLFRGAVLGLLRRFGDKTAIVLSALLFSFLHGNFIQGPFTFMFALFLGYVMCKTNNIVYPIVLHACNNGLSVLVSLGELGGETAETAVGVAYTVICIVFGIIGLIKTIKEDKLTRPIKEETGVLTFWQKIGTAITSPVVIVFMIFCLVIAFSYIEFI